jgi:hypothetical protein
MTDHFFTTTAGVKIPIQPISLLDLQLAQNAVEKEFRDKGEPIDPPTYEVEVFGSDKLEINPHTEVTIEDASDEEKEAWQKYLEAVGRLGDEIEQRTALVFLEGIIFDLPEDDSWIERRKKLFDEDVPEDEDGRKLSYINNVLLKTPADKSGFTLAIQRLSMTGVNEEAIDAMEELFRGQVELEQRQVVERIKSRFQKETEDMVLQSSTSRRASSESEGDDDAPIQKPTNRRSSRSDSSRKNTVKDV